MRIEKKGEEKRKKDKTKRAKRKWIYPCECDNVSMDTGTNATCRNVNLINVTIVCCVNNLDARFTSANAGQTIRH